MAQSDNSIDVSVETVKTPIIVPPYNYKRVPKKDVILKLCGAYTPSNGHYRQSWIENACHGLEDLSSLKSFFPVLNLDEVLAFAAKTRQFRNGKEDYHKNMRDKISSQQNIYDIFSQVFGTYGGMASLNSVREIPVSDSSLTKLNPFTRKEGLEDRLALVPEDSAKLLMSQLQAEPRIYYFLINDTETIRSTPHEKQHLLVPMTYMNTYPSNKNNRNNKGFATKIHKIFKEIKILDKKRACLTDMKNAKTQETA